MHKVIILNGSYYNLYCAHCRKFTRIPSNDKFYRHLLGTLEIFIIVYGCAIAAILVTEFFSPFSSNGFLGAFTLFRRLLGYYMLEAFARILYASDRFYFDCAVHTIHKYETYSRNDVCTSKFEFWHYIKNKSPLVALRPPAVHHIQQATQV